MILRYDRIGMEIPPPSDPAYIATPASEAAIRVSRRRACRSVIVTEYARRARAAERSR